MEPPTAPLAERMPTYEYECPKGHTFDVFQKMTDKPGAKCPECGQKASRKISGGAGFLFKGEGFYITDYRSEDYKKKASSESGESSAKSKDADSGSKSSEASPSKAEKAAKGAKGAKGTKAKSDA